MKKLNQRLFSKVCQLKGLQSTAFKRCLLGAVYLGVLGSGGVFAEIEEAAPSVYEVQVLAFEFPDSVFTHEQFPTQVGKPLPAYAVQVPDTDPQTATPWQTDIQRLQDRGYTVLYTGRWQHMTLGQVPDASVLIHAAPQQGESLEGFMTLSKPDNIQEIQCAVDLVFKGVRLTQTVFLKPNQLYYLDNPIFGVLLRVALSESDASLESSESVESLEFPESPDTSETVESSEPVEAAERSEATGAEAESE